MYCLGGGLPQPTQPQAQFSHLEEQKWDPLCCWRWLFSGGRYPAYFYLFCGSSVCAQSGCSRVLLIFQLGFRVFFTDLKTFLLVCLLWIDLPNVLLAL